MKLKAILCVCLPLHPSMSCIPATIIHGFEQRRESKGWALLERWKQQPESEALAVITACLVAGELLGLFKEHWLLLA